MAKADDSTNPPTLTRRTLFLAGAAITPATLTPMFLHGATSGQEPDPILALWQEWWNTDAEAAAFDKKWFRLEEALYRTPGPVRLALPSLDEEIEYATEHGDIEDHLGDEPETAAQRNRLHAELVALQARWDEAAAAIGFDDVAAKREAAEARAKELREAIFQTPAQNLAGVAAKLALVVVYGQPGPDYDEFPWPELRGVLGDFRRLAAIPNPRPLA